MYVLTILCNTFNKGYTNTKIHGILASLGLLLAYGIFEYNIYIINFVNSINAHCHFFRRKVACG